MVAAFFAGADFLATVFFAGADFFAVVFLAGAVVLLAAFFAGAAVFVDDFFAVSLVAVVAVALRVTRFAAAMVDPASLRAVVRAMSPGSPRKTVNTSRNVWPAYARLPHVCGEDMPHPHP